MGGLVNKSVNVLAGATNNNVLAGEHFEQLQRPSSIAVLASQDAGGGSATITLQIGSTIAFQDAKVNTNAVDGVIDAQRDRFEPVVGVPGDRVILKVQETGGSLAVDVNYKVTVTDLA